MAAARLSAYLFAIESVTRQRYGHIREILTDTLPLKTDLKQLPVLDTSQRIRLLLLSCAVCGIELCYAAETAFVSPILLRLGIPTVYATLTWCLSPLLGLVIGPVLGSLSDRCGSSLGRRRPFILLLSVGIVLGLVLVPHGQQIGVLLTGHGNERTFTTESALTTRALRSKQRVDESSTTPRHGTDELRSTSERSDADADTADSWLRHQAQRTASAETGSGPVLMGRKDLLPTWTDCVTDPPTPPRQHPTLRRRKCGRDATAEPSRSFRRVTTTTRSKNTTVLLMTKDVGRDVTTRAWQPSLGIVLTVIGVVLLDCCCDACQSPCRTYLLDVSQPENQAAGLTTFTVMAGLGGFVGYLLGGAIDWKRTDLGQAFGGHIQVSVLVTGCVKC